MSKTKDHSRQNNSLLNFFQRKNEYIPICLWKGLYAFHFNLGVFDLEQKLNETTRPGSSFLFIGINKMHLFTAGETSALK